jgi:hypothetical protein
MAVILQSFSQDTLEKSLMDKNNCVVAHTYNVEVMRRLTGGATEGAGQTTG